MIFRCFSRLLIKLKNYSFFYFHNVCYFFIVHNENIMLFNEIIDKMTNNSILLLILSNNILSISEDKSSFIFVDLLVSNNWKYPLFCLSIVNYNFYSQITLVLPLFLSMLFFYEIPLIVLPLFRHQFSYKLTLLHALQLKIQVSALH